MDPDHSLHPSHSLEDSALLLLQLACLPGHLGHSRISAAAELHLRCQKPSVLLWPVRIGVEVDHRFGQRREAIPIQLQGYSAHVSEILLPSDWYIFEVEICGTTDSTDQSKCAKFTLPFTHHHPYSQIRLPNLYIIVKLFYLLTLLLQLFIFHWLFVPTGSRLAFHHFPLLVIRNWCRGITDDVLFMAQSTGDAHTNAFPSIVFCLVPFHQLGVRRQLLTAQCVLPSNIYAKIVSFVLWCWTALVICYQLIATFALVRRYCARLNCARRCRTDWSDGYWLLPEGMRKDNVRVILDVALANGLEEEVVRQLMRECRKLHERWEQRFSELEAEVVRQLRQSLQKLKVDVVNELQTTPLLVHSVLLEVIDDSREDSCGKWIGRALHRLKKKLCGRQREGRDEWLTVKVRRRLKRELRQMEEEVPHKLQQTTLPKWDDEFVRQLNKRWPQMLLDAIKQNGEEVTFVDSPASSGPPVGSGRRRSGRKSCRQRSAFL